MEDCLLKWCPTKRYFRDGHEIELRVRVAIVRYQQNIEYFFSITCDERVVIDGRPIYGWENEQLGLDVFCHMGCDHEHIIEHFPELKPYIDLHLCSRFGGTDLFAPTQPIKIIDPYYTEEDINAIRQVERRVRLRKYLHERELIALMRSNS